MRREDQIESSLFLQADKDIEQEVQGIFSRQFAKVEPLLHYIFLKYRCDEQEHPTANKRFMHLNLCVLRAVSSYCRLGTLHKALILAHCLLSLNKQFQLLECQQYTHLALAFIHAAKNDYSRAISSYNHALKHLVPPHKPYIQTLIYNNLAVLYRHQKRSQLARDAISKASRSLSCLEAKRCNEARAVRENQAVIKNLKSKSRVERQKERQKHLQKTTSPATYKLLSSSIGRVQRQEDPLIERMLESLQSSSPSSQNLGEEREPHSDITGMVGEIVELKKLRNQRRSVQRKKYLCEVKQMMSRMEELKELDRRIEDCEWRNNFLEIRLEKLGNPHRAVDRAIRVVERYLCGLMAEQQFKRLSTSVKILAHRVLSSFEKLVLKHIHRRRRMKNAAQSQVTSLRFELSGEVLLFARKWACQFIEVTAERLFGGYLLLRLEITIEEYQLCDTAFPFRYYFMLDWDRKLLVFFPRYLLSKERFTAGLIARLRLFLFLRRCSRRVSIRFEAFRTYFTLLDYSSAEDVFEPVGRPLVSQTLKLLLTYSMEWGGQPCLTVEELSSAPRSRRLLSKVRVRQFQPTCVQHLLDLVVINYASLRVYRRIDYEGVKESIVRIQKHVRALLAGRLSKERKEQMLVLLVQARRLGTQVIVVSMRHQRSGYYSLIQIQKVVWEEHKRQFDLFFSKNIRVLPESPTLSTIFQNLFKYLELGEPEPFLNFKMAEESEDSKCVIEFGPDHRIELNKRARAILVTMLHRHRILKRYQQHCFFTRVVSLPEVPDRLLFSILQIRGAMTAVLESIEPRGKRSLPQAYSCPVTNDTFRLFKEDNKIFDPLDFFELDRVRGVMLCKQERVQFYSHIKKKQVKRSRFHNSKVLFKRHKLTTELSRRCFNEDGLCFEVVLSKERHKQHFEPLSRFVMAVTLVERDEQGERRSLLIEEPLSLEKGYKILDEKIASPVRLVRGAEGLIEICYHPELNLPLRLER